jgi:ketosteroid isomerase-like protein
MTKVENEILSMERAALDLWGNGDPSGFLEISAKDVVYFDPMMKARLDGHDALTALYEGLRGKVHVDKYELINPKVQVCTTSAILTFNYIGWIGEKSQRWNCTEVYRKDPEGWRIIQTHWSLTAAVKQ